MLSAPPKPSVTPSELTVQVGREASIECSTKGNPTPQIAWVKDGKTVMPNDRVKLLPNGILYFLSTKVKDTGTYLCEAKNIDGIGVAYGKMLVGCKFIIFIV